MYVNSNFNFCEKRNNKFLLYDHVKFHRIHSLLLYTLLIYTPLHMKSDKIINILSCIIMKSDKLINKRRKRIKREVIK